MTEYMTAAEGARRLGVKPATLYAYVSRGVLGRDKAEDGRGSLFDPEEVERLARRGRPRRPAGVADITVESAITEITAGRLRYRGLDAIRLAASRNFEDVAELLWTGQLPRPPGPPGAQTVAGDPAALAAGRAAQAALPAGTLPLERFQVIVPAMAATDPMRLQLDPAAVRAAGRSIIAGLVDCLPPEPRARRGRSDPADLDRDRLWSRLCATGRVPPCGGPCPPRWCCWPTTSWPPPRWPRGPPRRCGPTRTPWSRRAGRGERHAARRGDPWAWSDAGRGQRPG